MFVLMFIGAVQTLMWAYRQPLLASEIGAAVVLLAMAIYLTIRGHRAKRGRVKAKRVPVVWPAIVAAKRRVCPMVQIVR